MMSSVSRSSRISAKSQVIIEAQDKLLAEQGGQISEMAREMQALKQMLVAAGLNPVAGVEVEQNKLDCLKIINNPSKGTSQS